MRHSCHPRQSVARGRGPRCVGLGFIAAVCLMPMFIGARAATDPITDSDLVARASAVMSVKQAPIDRMLGVHKGVPVIVDIRCSDICPKNTVRIIHYTVEAGTACTNLGGDMAATWRRSRPRSASLR